MSVTLAHLDDGTAVPLVHSKQLFDIPKSARILPLADFLYVYAVVEGDKVLGWTNKFVVDNFYAAKKG